jgi:hypothetical protein
MAVDDGACAGIQLSGQLSVQLSIQVMSWRPCTWRTCWSGRLWIGPAGPRLVSIVPPSGRGSSSAPARGEPTPCPLSELQNRVGWMWSPTTPTAVASTARATQAQPRRRPCPAR